MMSDKNNLSIDSKDVDLKLLWEAYKIIKDNFYSFNTISDKELVYGIIKGMTDSLKDKHTEFFTPEETQKFNEALSGDFEGIGAVILHSEF
jgi:carboxyl-terminal processing protease